VVPNDPENNYNRVPGKEQEQQIVDRIDHRESSDG
jgi:hypothetical protein